MNDIELYKKYKEELNNIDYALFVLSFDSSTVCPKDDKERSYEVQNYFYKKELDIITSNEYVDLLNRLKDNKELSDVDRTAIKFELKELKKEENVPNSVKEEWMNLCDKALLDWEKARDTLDFKEFIKDFKNNNECIKETLAYRKTNKLAGYDILLDDSESNFTEETYDEFFNLFKKEILPLIKDILKLPKKYNEKIKDIKFDIDKQHHITNEIARIMGYDNKKGYIGETIHPFTNAININDARVTTEYQEELLFSNIYSVMHEIGHALYELGIDEKYNNTVLRRGTSCAIHESQSRFFENYIGRSREFVEYFYPILVKEFPNELKEFTVDDIYYYVNDVSNQLTRTEADELTYSVHILIRYEIEKGLMNGSIQPENVEKEFNERFYNYLGNTPKNMKEGCFQDIHWCSGYGYFPTYALGNAFGAQFLNQMKKEFDVFGDVKKGDLSNIKNWLKKNVWQFGASKENLDIIKDATKEEFNPKYYIDYLKNKFKLIYNL